MKKAHWIEGDPTPLMIHDMIVTFKREFGEYPDEMVVGTDNLVMNNSFMVTLEPFIIRFDKAFPPSYWELRKGDNILYNVGIF